jgi:hypothetical protein
MIVVSGIGESHSALRASRDAVEPNWDIIHAQSKRKTGVKPIFFLSGIGESNPLLILGKDAYYRCTNPATK